MVTNLGRKLTIVALVLGLSVLLLLFKDPPFRMGLDLQGGTRLSYRIDFEEAKRQNLIAENENEADILDQTIDIIYNRVDPDGVLEPVIHTEGSNRIVIELPGRARLGGEKARATSTEAIDAGARTLALDPANETAFSAFPESGGIVRMGEEQMRYEARRANVLTGLSRGHLGTPVGTHDAGSEVSLVSDDAIRNAIENLGELQFLIVAEPGDFQGSGTDLSSEEEKMNAWMDANPGASLAAFNRVSAGEGGPSAKIRWFPSGQTSAERTLTEKDRAVALLVPTEDWTFRGADLGKVYYTSDDLGYPAVGFETQPSRASDFSDFTGENVNRLMAIVLNGEVRSAPRLDQRLPGRGIVRGQFTQDEVRELVTVLRTGSLKIKPILEAEEVVGPTLGQDYVTKGVLSGGLGLLAVLLFMLVYYRRLGGYSAVSLAATMLMLMGGLAMFQATLTLPGIAGIILTVGMAVDANILIFDRIREEMDKGRNVKQAAKNGFDLALSTIVDANLTTLITAIILYKVGTGPVRGFAVTLSIGILASMFSALVITRLLVHFALEKGVKGFPMGTWLVEAKWKFLSKTRLCMIASSIVIVAGLALFGRLPDEKKLGIDFLGGGTVMFRTEDPQEIEFVRERIASIGGEVGRSEVKPVIGTRTEGGYTAFRTTFKIAPSKLQEGSDDAIDTFANAVSTTMGPLLQKGPVDVTTRAGEVELRMYFDERHSTQDVAAGLEAAGFQDVVVEAADGRGQRFTAKATDPRGGEALAVQGRIQDAFQGRTDSQGLTYNLSDPLPEKSLVGAKVVGELRDKAILALAISLFAIVMYIRVRFAEYSYGFAAVAALVHDVLTTTGALAVAMWTGIVDVEINLPMIAAFLTIIGYSLNDTIVIFDRVRENLPRTQLPFRDLLDLSINQTLSRTILTSLTTFISILVLFVFNVGTGNVLEGFSFAMMFGLLTGTYSTIFIACPILAWFEGRKSKPGAQHSTAVARAATT